MTYYTLYSYIFCYMVEKSGLAVGAPLNIWEPLCFESVYTIQYSYRKKGMCI